MAHATFQWLTNAIWAVLIWQKLEGRLDCSWWAVFTPTLVNHVLHIPMQVIVLRLANYMVYKQIGPPPPPSASPGLVLQYAILHHIRVRSHRVDYANNALESAALFVVKMLFADALHRGTLADTPLRLIFTPIWVCWVVNFALLCLKDRTERMFGSSRDLFFIFLLFVAFKVDDQSNYSWRVVFLVPWMWFSGLLLVAAMVFLLLLFAKVWARPRELMLPIGFLLLLLSSVPQFVSYIALVRRLDGDTGTSIASILWPNGLSWLLMWLSAAVIAGALRQKEALRDALLARGAVWTAHEGVARRLHEAERDEAQRRVDELSEEEVARLVESMMAGKSKPGRLRRVGENLYKRIASLEPALAEQAAAAAAAAAGGSAPASPTASTTAAGAAAAAAAAAGAGPEASEVALSASPPLSPAAGEDSSVRRRGGGASSGGAAVSGTTPASAGGGGGGGLGLFRLNNRVVPLSGGAAAPQAGPVTAAAAGAGQAVPVGSSPRGLQDGVTGGAAAAGLSAAEAGSGATAAVAAATSVAAADAGALSPRGSVPVLAAAPSRVRSGRSSSWLERMAVAAAAAAGTGGGGGPSVGGASLELTPVDEGRDVESGAGSFRERSRVLPEGSRPPLPSLLPEAGTGPSRHASQSQIQRGPFSRRPSEADSLSGSGAAAGTAAGAAAAAGQRRGRPSPLPQRQRPSSAVAASAGNSALSAAAAGAGAESTAAGASGSGAAVLTAATAARRPRSATTAAASTSAAPTPSGAGSIPRQFPALSDDGGVGSPRLQTSEGGGGGARDAAGGASRPSSAKPDASGSSNDGLARPSALAAAASTAACRASAVLPEADGDPDGPKAAEAESGEAAPAASDGAGAATDAGTAAAAAGGAGAGAGPDSGSTSPFASEREDLSGLCPAVADSHTPRDEGSVGAAATGADGAASAASAATGAAAASAAAAAALGDDDLDPDNTCVICYDGEASCVFLECGHGGFCRRCAFLLFVRPPNECPTCRAVIDQVVEIETVAPVGQVARVK